MTAPGAPAATPDSASSAPGESGVVLLEVYLVLGDFARDGTSATVKFQVNRMVSWIWLGGVVLTLGTLLAVLPERAVRPAYRAASHQARRR